LALAVVPWGPHTGNSVPSRMAPILNFEVWKSILLEDCLQHDKLPAFNNLGDAVLRMFWEREVEPSVEGIMRDCRTMPKV
jgi:hypothetical protein